MADNWGFVLAAYGLAAVVLLVYWRFLARRERDLRGDAQTPRATSGVSEPPASQTHRARSGVSEPLAPTSGHPRSKPASRPPLQ